MKRLPIAVLFFMCVALAVAPPQQMPTGSIMDLAAVMPPGSILCMQAADFASLLHDWQNSRTKQQWMASANYQEFSRSHLFERLQQAQTEFETAASVSPDTALLDSVAGNESALAIYDVGKLELLYITHLPSRRAMQSLLWAHRAQFQSRKVGESPYYVATNGRVVAFAIYGDKLFLATREDLLVGALTLAASGSQPSLKDEQWYKSAIAAAGPMADLRLVLNMPELDRSPHFRSYWIQRNITELKSYSAEVADIHRTPTEIREDRILIKADTPEESPVAAVKDTSLNDVLARVPEKNGIYRAWSEPSAEDVLKIVSQKLLVPHAGPAVPSQIAPTVALGNGEVGSENDLETRIDVAPPPGSGNTPAADAFKKTLEVSPLAAALEFEWLEKIPATPFVRPHSAIVIRNSRDWDADAVRKAVREAIEALYTVSQVGVNWKDMRTGAASYGQLDGLFPLALAVQGSTLILADSGESLAPLLSPHDAPALAKNTIYAAGFRHSAERENIVSMMHLIEIPTLNQDANASPDTPRPPLFLSENLASLSQSMAAIDSESVVIEDSGPQLRQTVVYQLKPRP